MLKPARLGALPVTERKTRSMRNPERLLKPRRMLQITERSLRLSGIAERLLKPPRYLIAAQPQKSLPVSQSHICTRPARQHLGTPLDPKGKAKASATTPLHSKGKAKASTTTAKTCSRTLGTSFGGTSRGTTSVCPHARITAPSPTTTHLSLISCKRTLTSPFWNIPCA